MVKFQLNTRLFKVSGEDLKGQDLLAVLMFLAFFIALVLMAVSMIGLPQVKLVLG